MGALRVLFTFFPSLGIERCQLWTSERMQAIVAEITSISKAVHDEFHL